MAWASGTTENFLELNLEYKDPTPEGEYKQSLLLAATGVDTTALTLSAIATFITHLEVVSNNAVVKAELRNVALTPFTNSSPKTPGTTTFATVADVAELPFIWVNPLIPSKTVKRTVGIPAPVAGKLFTSLATANVFAGTDSDSIAVLNFLSNYLVMKYPGNGLYYGGSVAPTPTFTPGDYALISAGRIIE